VQLRLWFHWFYFTNVRDADAVAADLSRVD
jgi:hypothetical protein